MIFIDRSGRNKEKEEIPEPGPPARPPLSQRVIVVPDPPAPRRYVIMFLRFACIHMQFSDHCHHRQKISHQDLNSKEIRNHSTCLNQW